MRTASPKPYVQQSPITSTLWSVDLNATLPASWSVLHLFPLFFAWISFSLWFSPLRSTLQLLDLPLRHPNPEITQLLPLVFFLQKSSHSGKWPLEGYRGPAKFTREQQNNPFRQRPLCHGRPSLAICTACWLPLLSSWGLNSWLWPEIVKLNVRLGPGSKIQHKYHGLSRYFNLAFNISCKVNISYVNMCTL